ncbi:MAG: DNA recombination/repair protein RecA, partial [Sulfurihydrogenibium sp.]|nr:DNA recombination/repair protein RecA [Sulfurihydrogenibium sp.]
MAVEENLEAKKKALESAILQIEKRYGKGTLMTLSSEGIKSVEVIPTGSLSLDIATGIGGVP